MAVTSAELRRLAQRAAAGARYADARYAAYDADARYAAYAADAADARYAADAAYDAYDARYAAYDARAAAYAAYAAYAAADADADADNAYAAADADAYAAAAARYAEVMADLVDTVEATRQAADSAVPAGTGRRSAGRMWDEKAVRLRESAVAALRGIPEAGRYAEEWASDMAQRPAGWARFRWALSLRLRAPRALRGTAAAKARVPAPPLPPAE